MYFRDFEPYEYDVPRSLERVFHVGWLEPGHEHSVGPVDRALLEKLAALAATQPAHRMRGYQFCLFCEPRVYEPRTIEIDGLDVPLGSAEIWIPAPDGACIYAAPNLIIHYIRDHRYLPPQPFLDAVDALDPSTWNGALECDRVVDDAWREHARAQGHDVDPQ